jgi:leader peptidase (prepilin peptidase) / N-methyltransferase
VPLLSWLILRGKSGCCKEDISVQYPLVEFLSMLIFIGVFYKNGFNIQSLIVAIVFCLFLTLSVMDYYYHAIFDSVSLTTLAIAVFTNDILISLHDAFIVAGGLTLLRFYVSYFLKKEAMGEGDIILGAAMGAVIGMKFAFLAVFVAAIVALPFAYYAKAKEKVVPFVPFLTLGVFLVYAFDQYANEYFIWIGL